MQSLLNSLSGLGKEDGAAIQILMRPANPSWRKDATKIAEDKRKGGESKLAVAGLAKDVAKALVKVPEAKEGGDSKKPELLIWSKAP